MRLVKLKVNPIKANQVNYILLNNVSYIEYDVYEEGVEITFNFTGSELNYKCFYISPEEWMRIEKILEEYL